VSTRFQLTVHHTSCSRSNTSGLMAVKHMLAKREACQRVLHSVHVLHAWETVIGGLRKKWYVMFTKENRYLCDAVN
jgi:hypothetical protein